MLCCSNRLGRIGLTIFALGLILTGIGTLRGGGLGYHNYWGGVVLAPLAIAIGLFVLYLAMFRWRELSKHPERLKGRAARRARRADEYRSAIDDFDKRWTGGI